jgi:hypothetical protein
MSKKLEKNGNLFDKKSVERSFASYGKIMYNISKDPMNDEINERVRFPFFPVKWDANQIYFFLKELNQANLYNKMCIIIATRDYSSIHDILMTEFVKIDEEEIGTCEPRYIYNMIPFKMQEHEEELELLNEYVKNFDIKIFNYLQSFLKKEYDFEIDHLQIIPEQIARVGVLVDTDYINSDIVRYIKDFIRLMRRGIVNLRRLPVVDYSKKEYRNDPFVNVFIKFATNWAGVEIDKFLDFIISMLESFSMNVLILGKNNKPVLIGRINIENGIMHVNPVPLSFLKKYTSVDYETPIDIDEITKDLYSYTKTQTATIKFDDFITLMKKITEGNYSFVSGVLDILQFGLEAKFYPKSVFATLISSLGVDYKKTMPKLKEALKLFVTIYERILFATLRVTPEGKRELDVAFCISAENDLLNFEQIQVDKYKEVFEENKTPVAIDLFEKSLVLNTNKSYPFIVIIKMKEFQEIFSYKNLTSFVELNKFFQSMQGLPPLEKLTSKIKGSPSTDKETEITEEIEETKDGLLEGLPSLNHFLTKGIILKISGGNMKLFTDSNYSGYLDLDVQKLRKFIKSTFPDILKD